MDLYDLQPPRLMLRLPTALAFFLLLSLSACDSVDSDDGNAPSGAATVAEWAGSYTGQSRFGGTNGRWGNGGTYPLVVSGSGQVTISGALITGTYDSAESTFTWTREAGNTTNGSVTFRETYTSDSFFGDFANDTAGQSFTGSIRVGSDGPLDYRGVLR